ncbi:hypothetical protein D3C85_979900 [compost metagenome]
MQVPRSAVDIGADQPVLAIVFVWRLLIDQVGQQAEIDLIGSHPVHEARSALAIGHEQGAALINRHQQQPLRIHVVEGRGGKEVPIRPAVPERIGLAAGQPILLSQHAALGKARGARGVLNVEQVGMGNTGRIDLPARGVGQALPREVAVRMTIDHHPRAIDPRGLCEQQFVHQRCERVVGHQVSGVAIG